jgi:pilus assembly protein Flp/PilA
MTQSLCRSVCRFLKSEDGPTAVEYAIVLAGILLLVWGAVGVLGNSTANSYVTVNNSVDWSGT